MTQNKEKQRIIILDANAFITGSSLLELGAKNKLVTTSNVLEELRDVKTRELLEKFVFQICQMQPTKKSIESVKQFAKKTGDISSLSDVDIQVLALAHTLYINGGLKQKIRKMPPPLKQIKPKQIEMSEEEEQQYEDEEQQQNIQKQKQAQTVEQPLKQERNNENKQQKPIKQIKQVADKNKEAVENRQKSQGEQQEWIVVAPTKKNKRKQTDDDLDENQGWITPQNFETKMAEGTATFDDQDQQQEKQKTVSSGISLMTADFAMQNVAIQMGIELKSLDGRQIKEIRRFILECYLCWKLYKVDDNQVKLCKQCGYNSLSKLAYSLTENGQMILHRKKGWKPNKKVLQWKQRKYEQQQKIKKNQKARRKKQPSIFNA